MRPDAVTGELELPDFAQYLNANRNDPEIQRMMHFMSQASDKHEQEKATLSSFDFSKLPLHKSTVWFIDLESSGFTTEPGMLVPAMEAGTSRKGGIRKTFNLTCRVRIGPGNRMDSNDLRMLEDQVGQPDSKTVEKFIRCGLAKPFPPLEPYIPNLLLISAKLKQHERALRPFLDSIPEPFEWHMVSPSVEEAGVEDKYFTSLKRFRQYLDLAVEKKNAGNKAFVLNNQARALNAYEGAIEYVQQAVNKMDKGDDAREREAETLLAVCYANCSAARLLDGKKRNPEKALEDAKTSVEKDPYYGKGYIRLSRAYEVLGDYPSAEESLAKALRIPQLEDNADVVDSLIELQTAGKGFPKAYNRFKEWSNKIVEDTAGSESAMRMRDVGGLWRKRYDEHRRQYGRLKLA
ncbi:hypothetical protein GALMADRAFT_242301 [Galerina marginata CBS 339.88]|uniref:Uncharacterized protein n=1 Tax=Galerina marginata (strain CBS 339.88) TaxID=685588 RepID=A0A067TCK4_GALM3|nr:hypothetical protein GALMADRAFT_242301 [Galerina marginata CBS 339.88]